jgi:hypothetical protein
MLNHGIKQIITADRGFEKIKGLQVIMAFRDITGLEPPPTPVSAKMYTEYGYPWFELYDEDKGDLAPADALGQVKSVKEMDQEKGFTSQQDDTTVNIENKQIKKIKTGPTTVKDGEW